MSDFIFKEGTVTTEIKVAESSFIDQDGKVSSIKLKCASDVEITENTTADYLDFNGEYIIESGIIKLVEELAADPNTSKKIYSITLFDPAYGLLDGNVNEVFNSLSPEDLIQDIVESIGLTFVNELPSASGITIPKVVYQDYKPIDAINPWLNVLQANWRVEGTNFILYKNGYNILSNVLIDAYSGWIIPDGWKDDTTNQATKVIVKGANITQRTTETLTGTNTVFYTSFQPENVEIVGLTQTTDTIVGDYIVDKENKMITFNTSKTDPVVTYSYNSQIRAEVGTGDIIKILNKTYIESRDDARKLGREYLKIYKDGASIGVWQINNFLDINIKDFKRGHKINVYNVMNQNRDGPYVITKIERNYPKNLKITVGEDVYNIFDWQKESKDRIQQLEQQTNNAEFVTQDVFQLGNVSVKLTANVSSLYVVLDDGKVLFASDTSLASESDLISDENWTEDFSTTNYKDASNTNATWSSTLNFTAGQYATSLNYNLYGNNLEEATLTATSTGTFEYFLNADGATHTDLTGNTLSGTVPTLNAISAQITREPGRIGNCCNFPGEVQIAESRTGTDTISFGKVTTYQKVAQSFVATGCGQIQHIRIKRKARTGTPSGNTVVRICADSSGSPGSSLSSKAVAYNDFNSLGTNESFISLTYSGVAGTTYWLTFEQSVPSDTAYENLTYDSSGSSGVLKYYNGSTWNTVAGSLYFAITTYDDIDLGASVTLPYNSFSIGFWLNTADTTRRQIIAQSRKASSGEIEIHSTTGAGLVNCLAMENKSNNNTKSTGAICTTLSDFGNWHHYLITNGTTYWTVYVDGVQIYQTTALTDTVDQVYRYIGSGGGSPGGIYGTCFKGKFDDITFYNVELDSTSALTLGTGGHVSTGLVYRYGLDETYGTKIFDNTKWETVNSGVAHTFVNQGTNIFWRAVEVGGTTGQITSIELESPQQKEFAIAYDDSAIPVGSKIVYV